MRLRSSSSAVRSTNWRYLTIFISSSTRSGRPDHTFGSLVDGSAACRGSVDARDSKSGSARATGLVPAEEAPLPVQSLDSGTAATPGHGRRELIFNSRGRYPLAWRWFERLRRRRGLCRADATRRFRRLRALLFWEATPHRSRQVDRSCFRLYGIPVQRRERLARMRRASIRRA
jgi:hypothetical protein